MYDQFEIKQRLVIIENSSLADAAIFDEKYGLLIRNAETNDERAQFLELRSNVQNRIKELTNNGLHTTI